MTELQIAEMRLKALTIAHDGVASATEVIKTAAAYADFILAGKVLHEKDKADV